MSEDTKTLVERLRTCGGYMPDEQDRLLCAAADRIEALEAALRYIASQVVADITTTQKMRDCARRALGVK